MSEMLWQFHYLYTAQQTMVIHDCSLTFGWNLSDPKFQCQLQVIWINYITWEVLVCRTLCIPLPAVLIVQMWKEQEDDLLLSDSGLSLALSQAFCTVLHKLGSLFQLISQTEILLQCYLLGWWGKSSNEDKSWQITFCKITDPRSNPECYTLNT